VAEAPGDGLSEKREITLVLRLLIERDGTIIHGRIVDPGEGRVVPFLFRGLGRAVQAWVRAQSTKGPE
jgi:hypothetical protein